MSMRSLTDYNPHNPPRAAGAGSAEAASGACGPGVLVRGRWLTATPPGSSAASSAVSTAPPGPHNPPLRCSGALPVPGSRSQPPRPAPPPPRARPRGCGGVGTGMGFGGEEGFWGVVEGWGRSLGMKGVPCGGCWTLGGEPGRFHLW